MMFADICPRAQVVKNNVNKSETHLHVLHK